MQGDNVMPRNYETRELDFNSPDGFGRDVSHDEGFGADDSEIDSED
jgi:hypothetical protein